MNKEELIRKLAELEWEDFEVKSAKSELPKNTWETVSAFSNTTGGWLLFGIRQQGKDFIAENAGFGFDKIDSNWKIYNNTAPEYHIAFDSTTVKLFTKTEKEAKKQPESKQDGHTQLLEQLRNKFGSIDERILKSAEENLADLRGIYGVFTRYFRRAPWQVGVTE